MRESVTIGQTTYFVQKFPAMMQMRIFGDLQKTLLPSLGKLLGSMGCPADDKKEKTPEQTELDLQKFMDGLKELSAQLDGESLVQFANTLIKADYVTFNRDDVNNGNDSKLKPADFDRVFDDMGEIVELVIFILKLNFSGFFTNYLSPLGLGQK